MTRVAGRCSLGTFQAGQTVQCSAPTGLDKSSVYNEKALSFSPVEVYPDIQDSRIDQLELSDKQVDLYIELVSSVHGEDPVHHLFGYPNAIQGNDMDLDCQLAANGVYGEILWI